MASCEDRAGCVDLLGGGICGLWLLAMNLLSFLPLEALGLEQTRTAHGVLLRFKGRMVAMVFQFETGFVVSLPSGNSETFDCKTSEGQLAALALIRQLRDEAAECATEVISPT
jgi:hypothetical protein